MKIENGVYIGPTRGYQGHVDFAPKCPRCSTIGKTDHRMIPTSSSAYTSVSVRCSQCGNSFFVKVWGN